MLLFLMVGRNYTSDCLTDKEYFLRLREEEGMELVHKTIVQRGEIFEGIRACLLESLKKEDLSSRIELLEELAELGHGITA